MKDNRNSLKKSKRWKPITKNKKQGLLISEKLNIKENRKKFKLGKWKWKMKLIKGRQCNQIMKNLNKKLECIKNTKLNKFWNCKWESKISSQVLIELKSQSTTLVEAKIHSDHWDNLILTQEDIATTLLIQKKNEI